MAPVGAWRPISRPQLLYAGPGAMLSHATALWWRGLLDHPPWTIEVSTPRYALANVDYRELLDLDALKTTAGAGRAGSTKLRNALARHEPKLARTRSPLEQLFLPLCEAHGVSWAQIQRDRSNELTLCAAGFDVLRYGTVQLEEQPALVGGDVITRLGSTARSA